jgi:uncharacterized protein (DUF1330 family)
MGLQKCKECGKEVSKKAKECPHCGAPVRKQVGIVTIMFAIIIAVVMYNVFSGQTQKLARVEKERVEHIGPSIYVSAYQLYNEYESNEIAADEKYKGKLISVGGLIDDIGKDIRDQMYITLKTDSSINSVQCFFKEENKAVLANLQKDSRVRVIGRCDGKFGNVIFKDCTIK